MASPDKPPLVVIAGATASGKSALALDIATRERGVVVNADASQLYADLALLSARPSPDEAARAPHKLYGVVDGATPCSAAEWAALASAEIAAAHAAGLLPIVVGGSGLYLRTLLDGIAPVPPIDASVRATVRSLPVTDAHTALTIEDPPAAARLAATDATRISRALEVVRATGRPLADWQRERRSGIAPDVALRAIVVERDRDDLYRRCDARFDAMIAEGALDEVAALAARRLDPALPVMKAVGVPPLLAVLDGGLSLADAIARAKQDTRRYAKRQLTWFRNQTPDWPRVRP